MALDNETLTPKEDLFLPGLVQQVFNKYKRSNGITLTIGERAQLFSELSALLGEDLVERALRLLDEWSLITYYTPDRLLRIIELTSKRNLAHVVRVVPGINYCKCAYFQTCVLQLPLEQEQLELGASSKQVSFTCEHILAQRLHQLLNLDAREQILTVEQFKYFHTDIYED